MNNSFKKIALLTLAFSVGFVSVQAFGQSKKNHGAGNQQTARKGWNSHHGLSNGQYHGNKRYQQKYYGHKYQKQYQYGHGGYRYPSYSPKYNPGYGCQSPYYGGGYYRQPHGGWYSNPYYGNGYNYRHKQKRHSSKKRK